MAAQYHTIDLARLALTPGEGRTLDVEVPIGPLELGGARYEVAGGEVAARLDVSRTAGGHAFRLAFDAAPAGPCMRCLEPARVDASVEAREVDQAGGDEELSSPYVTDEVLDLAAWAHDALALALPAQLLCRENCAGLCAVCGQSLNDADPEAHRHGAGPEGPFAKLSELIE